MDRIRSRVVVLGLVWLAPTPARAHVVATYVLGPEDDWCTFIDQAYAGGDLILLAPGDYVGPCTIRGKPTKEPEEITMIQGLDPANPPRFVHDGASDHVLRLEGEYVAIYYTVFDGIPAGVTAIQVEGDTRFWTRFNELRNVDGIGVHMVAGTDMRVQDTWFEGGAGVPATFGCTDGSCAVDALVFTGNVFVGTSGSIVHPGAHGVVADNIGTGLAAAGLVYAGSGGPGFVEANLLAGSGSVLEVDSAEAVVSNNIVAGDLAIGAADAVLGNTIVGNVELSAGVRFEGNAVLGELPGEGGGGNVACDTPESCWEDVAGWDFRPVVGGPLLDAGVGGDELEDDFCENVRGLPPDAGAVERTDGDPLTLEFKSHQDCSGEALVADLGGDPAVDPPGGGASETGCGCANTGSARGPWLGVLAWAALTGRRRRGRASARV